MFAGFEGEREQSIHEAFEAFDVQRQRALVDNFRPRSKSFEELETTRERDKKSFVVRI